MCPFKQDSKSSCVFNIFSFGVIAIVLTITLGNTNKISIINAIMFGVLLTMSYVLRSHTLLKYSLAGTAFLFYCLSIVYSSLHYDRLASIVFSLPAAYAYLLSDLVSPTLSGIANAYLLLAISGPSLSISSVHKGFIAGSIANAVSLTVLGYIMRRYLKQGTNLHEINVTLQHNLEHDPLTNLYNRSYLNKKLEEAIERKKSDSKYSFTLAFMDLDRFKTVNDSLGHNNGDKLLIETSRRLTSLFNEEDTLARFGGDEFAILIESMSGFDEISFAMASLLESLKKPFEINGYRILISASIGVVLSNEQYSSAEEYLKYADISMYQSKLHGKDRYEIFDSRTRERISKNLKLENDLKYTLERKELVLYYQPIVSLTNENIVGFEALVRWKHPEFGMVPPLDFIPLAEETGLIVPIGNWILREACKQISHWNKYLQNESPLIINVNISPLQLKQWDIVDRIRLVLNDTGVMPECLNIEITESALITDVKSSQATLQQIRDLGVSIHIDDFGTGYSSLSYLQLFPFNVLKVDRTFVQQLGENEKNKGVLKSIVLMAHELNMSVTGEGIETPQQAQWLKELGCEHGQGYYFSKPMDAQSVEKLLKNSLSSDALQISGF